MGTMPIEKRKITSSRLILGCMGFGGNWDYSQLTDEDVAKTEKGIDAALSSGISMFDHADIYRMGKAEEAFGRVLKKSPDLRSKMIIQSKCGIRFEDDHAPGRYDFSIEHIESSVDKTLKRLSVDYLDILLLHRPDPLMEPEEVSEVLLQLKQSGKVRYFGVSNMNKSQMELLEDHLGEPLIVNQLEMSLNKLDWIDHGVHVNQKAGAQTQFSDGLLEYCMLNQIQIQAWASLANGMFSGNEKENLTEAERNTKQLVAKMAAEKETSREAIVLGWLMRHPAKIQPVIGTTNPERIRSCADAIRISKLMTREEWYSLYVASRGISLP
ncbi:aldo/keto reductase [Metabacillus sp. RGM 3146]|uniref:aldo/keto reductase n=1 Tax=Metabacillus sp. RGM 3146 TaxID=3401092 RepID=UPI003B9AC730